MRLILAIMAANLSANSDLPDSWYHAFEQIESAGDPRAIGDGKKARGLFQFHSACWEDVSKLRKAQGLPVYPFTKATNEWVAREYARTWIPHVHKLLTSRIGRPATAAETWLAFNLGMTGFKRYKYQLGLVPGPKYDKAICIHNLTK